MPLTGSPSNVIGSISYLTVLSFDGDTFDANQIGYGTAVLVNETYSLYYAGLSFSNAKELGLATSSDSLNFVRYSNDPIVSPSQEPWFASFRILPSTVLYEDGTYKMWFFGIDSNSISDPNQTTGWGYATSSNGVDWSFGASPIRSETGSYQGNQLIEVVRLGDTYLSYYLDVNGPNYSVDTKYYVTFSTDGITFGGDTEFTTASGPQLLAATSYDSTVISIWSDASGYYTAQSTNGLDFVRVSSLVIPSNVVVSDLTIVGNSVIVWTERYEGPGSSGVGTSSLGQFELSLASFLSSELQNHEPVVSYALVDQSTAEDQMVSFVLPSNSFSDPDGDTLTYFAKLADGSALPTWLTFDTSTLSFTGIPPANFNGILQIAVTASDGSLTTTDMFALTLTPINDAPVLANALADQSALDGQAVSFLVPSNAFTDVDGDSLVLTAKLLGGLALPTWLSFNSTTHTFTGTPPTNFNGVLQITVTANDGHLTASDVFALTITPDPYAGWLKGTTGFDVLIGSLINDNHIYGDAGNDIILGGLFKDVLDGGAGDDTIFGLTGNDVIFGGAGADFLFGDFGNDRLIGGIGRDVLTGGSGSDLFAFLSTTELGLDALTRDIIIDFTKGSDKIDLSAIDARTTTAGDQAFTFLSMRGAAFTGVAGQLKWYFEDNQGTANDNTIIAGDTNGDGVADFQIEADGFVNLTATDFLL